jgi:hypothetical protein
MLQRLDLFPRARASGIHLLISASVAALAAALVFGVWYPREFRDWAGGRELFFLLTSVDVALGPLLTLAVFNLKKGWPHLRRDLLIIAVLQLGALGYGLYAVYLARPVALVYEKDRFRVITAVQVQEGELYKAAPAYQKLSMTGPWLLGTREPTTEERNDALFMAAVAGVDHAERPSFWQPYADSIPEVLKRGRPLAVLFQKYPEMEAEVNATLDARKVDRTAAKFFPLLTRRGDWVAIVDGAGQPVHYLRGDAFF